MNKVLKNYVYNFLYQILVILVPLITTPYVSRVLGAKGIGTFSYTNSIVQYFILFGCIGLNLYGQREIAYVQHDKKERDNVFWELFILRVLAVSVSLLVYYLSFVSHGKYASVFLIMSLEIFASLIDISWFFQGIEEFKKIVIRNLVVKVLGVTLIFLLVKSSDDLILYTLCHSGTLLLGNISIWAYVPKYIGNVKLNELHLHKHIKPTIILFLPQIATSIYTVLDKTMIGYLAGIEEEVAYYEQGQKIVKLVLTLVTSLGTVMMPRIANLYKQNEITKVSDYLAKSFRFVFFMSFPMMFGLMAICCNIVPWFFGKGYNKVIPNMMIISPIVVFIALSNIVGIQYLLPTGRQKEYTISVLIGCIVNFIMNLLLIPKFMSIGAAIATVLAEGCVTSVQMYLTRKDINYFKLLRNNKKYISSSLIMFIPTYMLALWLPSTITNSFLCILAGCIIYVCLLFLKKDDIIYGIIKKCKSIKINK